MVERDARRLRVVVVARSDALAGGSIPPLTESAPLAAAVASLLDATLADLECRLRGGISSVAESDVPPSPGVCSRSEWMRVVVSARRSSSMEGLSEGVWRIPWVSRATREGEGRLSGNDAGKKQWLVRRSERCKVGEGQWHGRDRDVIGSEPDWDTLRHRHNIEYTDTQTYQRLGQRVEVCTIYCIHEKLYHCT